MDRSRSVFRFRRRGLVAALLIASVTATGCTGPILTAMYLIKGTDVDQPRNLAKSVTVE